jgi:N-acetylneuraminic acid mutarotase
MGAPTTFCSPEAVEKLSGITLTFAQRVAYQQAIEEVRWRHRIWPKDNPGPKPPLDAVLSRKRIEKKVTDYLRKSQLLADQRGRPIAPSELQAEMDRMVKHTKQPEVLRELFEALGNDPFVIAECLARAALAERLPTSAHLTVADRWSLGEPDRRYRVLDTVAVPSAAYMLPQVSEGAGGCTDDTWTATTVVNAPDAREGHTAVWTGSEIIIWGGFNGTLPDLNTGARYDPATDSWIATSITNAPIGRWLHTALWTGGEIIVWGGGDNTDFLNTGGRYNPADDTWTATSTANAPTGRVQHKAVWTGSEMVVWGGYDYAHGKFNTGGRYDPSTDSWTATSTINAPEARWYHRAIWTGSEMVVWGGTNQTIYLNTGGRYNPNTDSWTPTGLVNAPLGRIAHTAIWSGNEMDVWGGVDSTFNDCNTGGKYNPTGNNWTPISTVNAPSARDSHTAVWTGTEMVVWGGEFGPPDVSLDTGGRYNPGTDSWLATSMVSAPHARDLHTAVWTGGEMIVWGGAYWVGGSRVFLNTGGRYCAQSQAPMAQSAFSRKTHGGAGTFDIPLPLSGNMGIECRSGGATNDYTVLVRFTANVTVNGNPQAAVTSGIGTIGSGGVSNGGRVHVADNLVTIPLTNVANAQTIQVTLNGVNGTTNFEIPISILIGDTTANGRVNASDIAQTKLRIGQQINDTNFRSDVNANGYIDAADVSLVKSNVGTAMQ